MAGEFKVASGYIEVVSKVNERSAKAGADAITDTAAEGGKRGGVLAGDAIADGVKKGSKRAGDSISEEVEKGGREGGKKAGNELGKGLDDAGRSSGPRILSVFSDLGKKIGDHIGGAVKKGAEDGSAGAREALKREGDRSGTLFGNLFNDRVKDLLTAGALLDLGKQAAGLFMSGFEKAIAQDSIGKLLVAKTGSGEFDARKYGAIAGDLYAKGFGDSVEQVGEALTQVIQSGVADLDATPLDQMAGSALNVAKILGEDVKPVLRDVATLLRTGMAKNAQEAFDILVKGEQSGANAANDLLDTLQEYPVQFQKLGIQGPQAIGLIAQAMKAGARSSDLAADALKEFSIRAVDGSKLTGDGFKMLGLDAGKMASDIAAGGSRANGALDLTLDRLRAIPDPVKRSQAAVALFGTQAEDLGKALFSMDPSNAVDALGQVGGAAEKAGDQIDAADAEKFKRSMEQNFVGYIDTKMIPAVMKWQNTFSDFGKQLDDTFGKGTGSKVADFFTSVFATPASPETLMVTMKPLQALVDSLEDIGKSALPGVKSAWHGVEDFFTETIPGWFNSAVDWISGVPGRIGDALSSLPGTLADSGRDMLNQMAYDAGYATGAVVKFFADLPGNIWNAIAGIPGILGDLWDSVWNVSTPKLQGFWDGVTGFFIRLPGNIWSAISGIPGLLGNVFSSAWNWATNIVNQGVGWVLNAVRSLPGQLWSLGGDIVNGLINGINRNAGRLWNLAWDMAKNFLSGFRKAIDSGSPSRIMDHIGENEIGAGLLRGLGKVNPKLPRAASSMADAFVSSFVTAKTPALASAAGGTPVTPAATGSFGPYVIEIDGRQFASFVIDAVTGAPKRVAAAVDEGRRQRGFVDSARARR